VVQALRHVDFRRLWLGQTASVIGDRLVIVALGLFVVQETGSATDLGLVLGAHAAPLVLLLLIGGVWADRLPRTRVIIASDLVRAVLHAVLALLILTGAVEIWHVVVIELGFGTAEAFFRPAYTGLVPQTVPEELVQQANAMSQASWNVAQFVGPALATALVVWVGAGWAFAVDAATFLVSAALVAGVHPRRRGTEPERVTLIADLRAGFAEVRSRSWVWVTILVFSVALFTGLAPLFVLGPIVARDLYDDTTVFGLVTAAFGAGAVVGSVVGVRWRPARPMLAAFIGCYPWPVMLGLYGAGVSLWVVAPFAVAAGFGIALFGIWWETALAQRIPPHALSRVSAYDWMGSLALLPIGYLLAGPLAEAAGAQTVVLAGAGVAFVAMALGLVPRQTRELARLDVRG
jgi:predicted MFS family arabinose efflux permease